MSCARNLFAGLIVLAAYTCVPSTAFAQAPITFQYLYDETGQLIRVVDSTGVVIEYVYDAVGNALEVRRSNVNPTQLTILGFSPAQGRQGTIVTIDGVGFSNLAADNLVSFNGVPAPVISSTANALVAQVPVGASSGLIKVSVASRTATSASSFTVLALPIITSVIPRAGEAASPPASLTLTGTNLAGAHFNALPAFVPVALSFGAPQINASGTMATVPVSVNPTARGTFVIIATNGVGSSDSFASGGNTFLVTNALDAVDSDGDGFPDGLELLLGSDPSDPASVPNPNASGEATSLQTSLLNTSSPAAGQSFDFEVSATQVSLLNTVSPVISQPIVTEVTSSQVSLLSGASPVFGQSLTFEVTALQVSLLNAISPVISQSIAAEVASSQASLLNAISPVAGQGLLAEIFSPVVSLQNATTGSNSAGAASPASIQSAAASSPSSSVADTQSTTRRVAPLLRIEGGTGDDSLYEGQTVMLAVDLPDVAAARGVSFVVNGSPFAAVVSVPYALTFTVPSGSPILTFQAVSTDSTGVNQISNELTVSATKPSTGAIVGRVVDSQGVPLRNAIVEVTSSGLRAQYFDFQTPLTAIPDLRGRQPDFEGFVSAINVLNPDRLFGSDPLGAGLTPDYAARFTGVVSIETAGRYQFAAIADEGERVVLGGVTVVDRRTGDGLRAAVQADVDLPAGAMPVEITYYRGIGNAELQLYYRPFGGEWRIVPPEMLNPGAALVVATTDENGVFVLDGLPVHLGALRVAISHANALTERLEVVLSAGKRADVGDIALTPR